MKTYVFADFLSLFEHILRYDHEVYEHLVNMFRNIPISFISPFIPVLHENTDTLQIQKVIPLLPSETNNSEYNNDTDEEPKEWNENSQNNFFQNSDFVSQSVWDILGIYKPENYQIVLYSKAIEYTAKRLSVSFDILRTLVLIHEIGHAVSHIAYIESEKEIWKEFHDMKSEVLEAIAQHFLVLCIRSFKNQDYKTTFEKLEKYQPTIYHGWQKLPPYTYENFHVILRDTRIRNYQSQLAKILNVDIPLDLFLDIKSQGMGINMHSEQRLILGFDGLVEFNNHKFSMSLAKLSDLTCYIRDSQVIDMPSNTDFGIVMDGSWEEISLVIDGKNNRWSGPILCASNIESKRLSKLLIFVKQDIHEL